MYNLKLHSQEYLVCIYHCSEVQNISYTIYSNERVSAITIPKYWLMFASGVSGRKLTSAGPRSSSVDKVKLFIPLGSSHFTVA